MERIVKLVVTLGTIEYFVEANIRVTPGEPMVQYYPDGSGYPGSDDMVDCIDSVEVLECEYITRRDGSYRGLDRADMGDCAVIADRWVHEELSSGLYDNELLDYGGYNG